MRTAGGLVAVLISVGATVACGGTSVRPAAVKAAPATGDPPVPTSVPTPAGLPGEEPIAAVSVPLDGETSSDAVTAARLSYLVPGRVQLEIGGPFIEGPGGNVPMRVGLFDRNNQLSRVAVRLANARFAVWTESTRLLAVLQEDVRVDIRDGVPAFDSKASVTFNHGAPVRRLAHDGSWTKVRYQGALEVEGWVPDASIADSGVVRREYGRRATAFQTTLVTTGATIRADTKWASQVMATVSRGYLLSVESDIDDNWSEVSYADDDVAVRGFLGRHEPPSSVHYVRPADVPPPFVVTNTKLASGTCLYSSVDGDAIGYLVDDPAVELEPATAEWWTVTLDTPWGPIAFAAKGPTAQDLALCAPAGAVEPSKLKGAPPPPPISVP